MTISEVKSRNPHKLIEDMQKVSAVATRVSDVTSGGVSEAPVRQSILHNRPDGF